MTKVRIHRVIGQELVFKEPKRIWYYPRESDKRLIGLLMTKGVELSMTSNNGTEILFHKQEVFHTAQFSPDRRIIKMNEPLEQEKALRLIARSNATFLSVASIYLVIEQDANQ